MTTEKPEHDDGGRPEHGDGEGLCARPGVSVKAPSFVLRQAQDEDAQDEDAQDEDNNLHLCHYPVHPGNPVPL
ncbi:MAG: hypothetical protein COA84_14770 [Robiginitomaculum sp.]|nr:MAG: hypothetical protein COA84_14770 [Robiginitomaculum sp.]